MGYLTIDNQGSDKGRQEFDTLSCPHCQAVLIITRHSTEGGWCHRCKAPVCPACAQNPVCTPFVKQIEAWLTHQARRRAMGL